MAPALSKMTRLPPESVRPLLMVRLPPFSTVMSVARVTPVREPAVELSVTPPLVATVPPETTPPLPNRKLPLVPARVSVPALVSVLVNTAVPPWNNRLPICAVVMPDCRLTTAPVTIGAPPVMV